MSATAIVVELMPAKTLKKLQNEYGVLHLLFARNHNQHRVATWWKYLEMIHLNTRKILKKAYNIESAKKLKVKEKLRLEALAIARYMIKKKLFTNAFFAFNGIIALGQFVTLGLGLLGITSSIFSILSEIDGISDSSYKNNVQKDLKSSVTQENDDDLGVEVEMPSVEQSKSISNLELIPLMKLEAKDKPKKKRRHDEGKLKEPKAEQDDIASIFGETRTKKKKKKKNKSAMDDIFG